MNNLSRLVNWFKGIPAFISSRFLDILVLFLAISGVALAWSASLGMLKGIPALTYKVIEAAGIGVGAAALTRKFFQPQGVLVCWLIACLCLAGSLFLLAHLPGQTADSLQSLQFIYAGSSGLWQYLVGGITVLVTLLGLHMVGNRPVRKVPAARRQLVHRYKKFKLPRQSDFIEFPGFPRILNYRIAQRKHGTRKSKQASQSIAVSHVSGGKNRPAKVPLQPHPAQAGQPTLVIQKPRKASVPASAAKVRAGKQPRGVRLVGKVDHRCPYCLDPVDVNDPGGVVECEICHSLHHKSCWDVTGTCQVPHLH